MFIFKLMISSQVPFPYCLSITLKYLLMLYSMVLH